MDDASSTHFLDLKARFFDALCLELGVSPCVTASGDYFAIACADVAGMRVFFDYERGLGHFALGAATDDRPICSVDEIADRFPRVRSASAGEQRLSLEEQAALIESHLLELQAMFSPSQLPETRAWKKRRDAAYTQRCGSAANYRLERP